MTQAVISKSMEITKYGAIGKTDQDEAIIDVFGSIRVWNESEDYTGINIELVEEHRRLATKLGPTEAARLSLNLVKFILKYIASKHLHYSKSIDRLEQDIADKIDVLKTPSIVYAGNDEVAINKVSSELKDLRKLLHILDKLTDKHNLAWDLLDKTTRIISGLEDIYKALHII